MRRSDKKPSSSVSHIFEVPAHRLTVELLRSGSGCEAIERAEHLIAKGDEHGYTLLGAIYEFGGHDLAPNPEKALHNYSMAIELSGSVEGALGYARIKYLGKDGKPDIAEARRVYERLAELENRIGHYMYAKILLEGQTAEADIELALLHATAALQLGVRPAKQLLSVATSKQGKLIPALRWSVSALIDRLAPETGGRTI
jgi:TPR repeat protein